MISKERMLKVEASLKDNDTKVEVLWDQQEKAGNDYKVPVKCLHDDLVEFRAVSTLMKGKFFCQQCAIRKYSEKLKQFDFSFIDLLPSEEKQSRKVLFACNKCNFERSLSVGNVLNSKSLSCDNCRKIKVKNNLQEKSCSFIRSYLDEKGFCRVVYEDKTGQQKEVYESNILRGIFSPANSHWDQAHHLYIFISNDDNRPFIKIGTANEPKKRLRDLKLDFNCNIISCKFETRYAATKVEKNLHKLFVDFSISKSLAESFTEGLSKPTKSGKRIRQGCTEWFTKDCLNLVLQKAHELGVELT